MYSKIPMPQSEWTEENMSYAMCFFPWVGAVTGGMSYLVVLFADLLKEREISFGSLFFPALSTRKWQCTATVNPGLISDITGQFFICVAFKCTEIALS